VGTARSKIAELLAHERGVVVAHRLFRGNARPMQLLRTTLADLGQDLRAASMCRVNRITPAPIAMSSLAVRLLSLYIRKFDFLRIRRHATQYESGFDSHEGVC
jgi:hypothetical protein